MLAAESSAILDRVLIATKSGHLCWTKDSDGWFFAPIGTAGQQLLIRQMYLEATNQVGADPYFVEFCMPGWNARFAITDDSDGWNAIRQILDAAFPLGRAKNAGQALEFLNLHLPENG